MKTVFLDRDSLLADVRRPTCAREWQEYSGTLPEQVVERLQGAAVVITNKVPISAAMLAQLPQLKLVAVAATGVNPVDLTACRQQGVVVSNIRDYAVHSVPEHVLMLMLNLRRNFLAYLHDVRAGEWQRASQFCLLTHPIHDISGSVLGIVGRGSIGLAVARMAEGLGMRVLFAEHKGSQVVREGYTAFEEVLRQSDVVSLHCPLNDKTRGLIGAAELALMQPHALLINTARGGLVDELALLQALQSGRLGGAGFDVLSSEPPAGGNPLLEADLPNLIVTPHIAWASRQAMQTLADQLIDNIDAFARGELRNRVV